MNTRARRANRVPGEKGRSNDFGIASAPPTPRLVFPMPKRKGRFPD